MSKQRVYSAEGTPLNFLDTIATVRHTKERERERERKRKLPPRLLSIPAWLSIACVEHRFRTAHVKKCKVSNDCEIKRINLQTLSLCVNMRFLILFYFMITSLVISYVSIAIKCS